MHLGHLLHQDLTWAADAKEKRGKFISRSVEVRSQFAFAAPLQTLKAVRILTCDAYGSVLWRLDSPSASAFFKSYTIRRVYRLPVSTFTYLVEGHLAASIPPLRNMVLGRYPKFYWRLRYSPSEEVSVMAEVVARDLRSVTASNLRHLSSLTQLDCSKVCGTEVKDALKVVEVPEKEKWRTGLLDVLLRERAELERGAKDTKRVNSMLASLCYT